ncbi:MAG: hypothetical protein OQL16_01650 [Gammaproteobacteria bacterium]|nr:hypothetical protein [Gammaproteobacteria bacterium]
MKHRNFYLGLITCMLLAGCSDEKQHYAEMSGDNIFKGQVEAVDKAKAVESTIQSSFDQRGQQVE